MDGSFERLNSISLKTAPQAGQVISLVGRVIDYDGVNTATLESADGGRVQVGEIEVGSFQYVPNMICEIMGTPMGENSIQVSSDIALLLVLKSPATHNNSETRILVHVTCQNVDIHKTKTQPTSVFPLPRFGRRF